MDDWMLHGRFESRIEEGESFYDMQARFVPLVEGLIREFGMTNLNFLLVGHGGLYLNMLPLVLKNISRNKIGDLPMGNTILIVSEYRPEGLVCLEWGDLPIL
jgi:broad specificity phosphatase PhoE